MEFEEMKKVWDSQNQKSMYVIDESVLHNRIRSKKKRAQQLATWGEIVLISSMIIAGSMILLANILRGEHIVFKYITATMFYLAAVFLFIKRMSRKKGEHDFENSMMGDLEHALSNSTHQVRLSATMLYKVYPMITIGAFFTEWISSGFSWLIPSIAVFFIAMYYPARWEHSCYVSKQQELEGLKRKLLEEPVAV